MKLRVRALALAAGIVWGLYLFLGTLWLLWFRDGATIPMFVSLYPGYETSVGGAFMGLLWGFVDGVICGGVVAWLYNQFHKVLYKSERAAQ
jgi:hypothetical protein